MGYTMPRAEALRTAFEKPRQSYKNVLLTIPEACEYLRVSKWTVYRLFDDNKLKTVRVRGRRLVPRIEVENFIATQRAEGAA